MGAAHIWRTVGFVTAYGLAVVGVTAAFWRSPQPSADALLTPLGSPTSITNRAGQSAVEAVLTQPVALTANTAYGIQGSAVVMNRSTVVLKSLSILGRGPKTQVELRDAADQTVVVLRDITKLTLNQEDLVLAVPDSVDLSTVASLAITAPDYDLVLSRARWK